MLMLRYLSRQIVLVLVGVAILLTFAVWITQSLRFVPMILLQGVPLDDFLLLMLWLLPDLLLLAVPAAFLVSVLFVYNRFIAEHECVVMKSAGCSPSFLLRPIVWVGSVTTLLLYGITLYLLPLSMQLFREKQVHFRSQYSRSMIHEGEFNRVGNFVIYADQTDGEGGVRGLFAYDARLPHRPLVITAQEAVVEDGPEGGLQITLHNGTRQTFEAGEKQPSLLEYQHYVLQLRPEVQAYTRKSYEMFPHELWQDLVSGDRQQAQKSLREMVQRLVMPLYAVCFGLLAGGLMLRGSDSRSGRQRAIFSAVAWAFLIELLSLILLHAEGWGMWFPPLLAVFVVCFPLFWVIFQSKGARRHDAAGHILKSKEL